MRKLGKILGPAALATGLGACLAILSARAAEESIVPAPPRDNNTLQLPGLPPIQMPPGVRVFGPNNLDGGTNPPPPLAAEAPKLPELKPADEAKKPEPRKRSDLNIPATRNGFLDELFARLGKSADEEEAKGIAGAIERVWLRSGSDTADLLMNRAMSAFQSKDYPLSIELFDKLLVVDPEWAEAWNKRATAKYFSDDYAGAMADIGEVLKLEPRHFGALSGMGFILQRVGMERRALEVFRKTLAVYPKLDDIRKIVDKLSLEIDGRDI